jgi:hypothetical protein
VAELDPSDSLPAHDKPEHDNVVIPPIVEMTARDAIGLMQLLEQDGVEPAISVRLPPFPLSSTQESSPVRAVASASRDPLLNRPP